MSRAELTKTYDATIAGFKRRLPDQQPILDLALGYMQGGLLDISIGYLALATAMYVEDPVSLTALGLALSEKDRPVQALACLNSAVAAGGANPAIQTTRKRCVEQLGVRAGEMDIDALRWDPSRYFVTHRGCDRGREGSLVFWIGPFTGVDSVVEGNILKSFSDLLDTDMIVMNVLEYGMDLDIQPDRFLHAIAADLSPDLLLYYPPTLTWSMFMPRLETIAWMRHVSGAALVTMCLDLAKPFYKNIVKLMAGASDLVVTTDQPADPELIASIGGRVMSGWHVVDTTAFSPRGQDRDIAVSFVGKFDGHYSDREPLLTHLLENGIELFLGGNSAGRHLSNEEYADVMRRSKIAVNFCEFQIISIWDSHPLTGRSHPRGEDGHQMKARVFEVMESEALLLESENSVIAEWFEPGVHFVSFSGKDDLLEKVRYYLAHEEERCAIAKAGRLWAREHYTAEAFWHGVLDPLQVEDGSRIMPKWKNSPVA